MTGELLTVAEVANRLRVSKMTIYRLIHAGDLPALRVGHSFRVPADAPAVAALLGNPTGEEVTR